ncbi:hypothetical protein GCG54_00015588 [Colletotrichum gloeosporioides]|uniref:Uncharacterized protein n=1 Tax=Colletotrichum gloeosporioides TaxID=474922 RepID=A0A8H4CXN9_COLGL|nr:uncharacterized protein GCG54_00015588 [Colletotrichum gloeosporioides]KAF3812038.1 hypothetical protein GCG54_00015588 [Colletotrichum gloeosporioides]
MNQHIIRHSLNLRSCHTRHMDEVEAAMHMVRPGPGAKRWSAEFDRLMVPRMKDALQGRFRELGKAGVWRYDEDGEVVYEEWAKAFVKEEWDGVSFSKEDAERLLALDEKEVESGSESESESESESRDDEDEDERGTVRPEDSVSNVFILTPPPTPIRSRVAHRAQLPPVAEEEEEQDDAAAELDALSFADLRNLMLEAAGNLFDFKVHLDFLDHGVAHAGAEERVEAETMRDRCLEELRVLEGALDRAAVREMGIREVGVAKAPLMGAIWERLLGGVVRDAN